MTEELHSPFENSRKRVVLVGAGDAGLGLAKELALNPDLAIHPVAIVDDDSSKHGTTICNVPVVGSICELERLVKKHDVEEVLICIPSATRSEISKILAICLRCEIPVRTLPSLGELINKHTSWRELRQPCIEDILQRAEILLETKEIRELIQGKVVLVSGAGGSIGSELCRQIAAADPRCLLLLDKSENSLFYSNLEIREHFPNLQTYPLLLDVVQRQQVERVFRKFRPELVFHAAAFKHVGLCEGHPIQTIQNNVIGTRNIAVAAANGGVHRFVNISTDKAVNPSTILGFSKKLTELCIQEISKSYPGRFSSVRFGNVAGSTGSVIRLFWDQIQKGGPLRITDSRATRYFLAISEAVYLIIRAAQLCRGGETFVFDMGKPISILELAKTLCLLSGLKPYIDISIEFVGIHEGEKINEELWENWEKPERTSTDQILVIAEQDPRSFGILKAIEQLESCIEENDVTELLESARHLCRDVRRTWGGLQFLCSPAVADSKERPMNVPLSLPDIGELEVQYVTDVLRSGHLSMGPRLSEFEDKFARYVGTRFAVTTSSGTSALHLIMRALEIGPEDEVITTSFSFFASTACILYERALPVFVDIDPFTLNIDPVQVRSFLQERCFKDPQSESYIDRLTNRKVKAILPVHLFGLPCEMGPLMDLAAEYKLSVIEDACEALGAKYQGRHVGTFGGAAAFAFYPNKQLTTAEGGMIVTNDEQIALLARSMRNQGRDLDSKWLQHMRLGYNYRLSDVHCAIGIAQLKRLPELMELRSQVANRYDQLLEGIAGLTLPYTPPWCDRSWFAYVARFDNRSDPGIKSHRNRIMQALRAKNIGCQPYFPAIHLQPYFQEIGSYEYGCLANTERAANNCLALPMFSKASSDQISYVCESLLDILKKEPAELIRRDLVIS